MTIQLKFVLCLTASLCSSAVAQTATTPTEDTTSGATSGSPVAYVYVSSTLAGGSVNEIRAFAAARDGKLTPIHGSPFEEDVTSMAVNGKYLFAANSNRIDIESFKIESDGALLYAKTTNVSQASDCNDLGPLFLGHAGDSLYDLEINGVGCVNNTYESFTVLPSTGELKNVGNSSANGWLNLPASFIGDNTFAYSAVCIQDMFWGIYGFHRHGDGLLSEIAINAEPPTPPDGYFYCPSQTATDQTGHVAISMQPVNQEDFAPDRPAQLAAYKADGKGNLSTRNTHTSMPETDVVGVTDLEMSPGGKLLAVGGTGGLQIFHFNGSDPITHYTGLLTNDEIDQFFWDSHSHLYAISRTAGKLYVFTVTPTSFKQAPDSPYTVNMPRNIIVQPVP